jgi:RNA ligase (TIGR02306 family)
MSHFEVPIVRITKVEDHPNADRLSLNYFREYITISAKLEDGSHRYKEGDLVVYVPVGAIVPEWLLKKGFWDEKNNKGILAGSKGNRVKDLKIRGVLSQGIMFPVESPTQSEYTVAFCLSNEGILTNEDISIGVNEGDNVAEFLGITKYEPTIPASMEGEVVYIGMENVLKFDLENIKKYPELLVNGDVVEITEKLHGTMMGIGYNAKIDNPELWSDETGQNSLFCFSKGLGSKGLVFKNNEKNAQSNVYVKIMNQIHENLTTMCHSVVNEVFMFGEVAGNGIQDLGYGFAKPQFRLFGVAYMINGYPVWVSRDILEEWAEYMGVECVPLLYRGPWNPKLRQLRDGKSTLADHIREGIVIATQYADETFRRVILKDVSEDYLTRKNGTELQ